MADRGVATFYRGKIQKPVTANFTDEVRKKFVSLGEHVAVSKSDLFEHLTRKLFGLPISEELDKLLEHAIKKI